MKIQIKTGRKLMEINSKGFAIGWHVFESHTFATLAFIGKRNVLEVNGIYFVRF